MKEKAKRARITFHMPIITIFLAIAIPLVTLLFYYAPHFLKESYAVIFLTSPFNIIFELGSQGSGIFWNYLFIILAYFVIETYSRNLADIRGREAMIDNTFYFSVLAAYVTSLIIWAVIGVPSVGTSVIGFTIFIFFAFETMDSELIERISTSKKIVTIAAIAIFAFVALVLAWSMLLFVYINGNQYWYVHMIGGAIFALALAMYVKWLRISLDMEEEKIKEDAEKIENETVMDVELVEAKIKDGLEKKAKKTKKQPNVSN